MKRDPCAAGAGSKLGLEPNVAARARRGGDAGAAIYCGSGGREGLSRGGRVRAGAGPGLPG